MRLVFPSRRLRRHVVPGHRGGVRARQQHVEQRHGADVGALGPRVGRVLPARGAARARAARGAQEARQAAVCVRLVAVRHVVRLSALPQRRHPHCQQHHRNPVQPQDAQRLHVVNGADHRHR